MEWVSKVQVTLLQLLPIGLKTPDEVTQYACPYAVGLDNEGFRIPPETILVGNAFCMEYIARLSLTDLSGLRVWIRLVSTQSKFKDRPIMDFLRIVPVYCTQHLIPDVVLIDQPESRATEMNLVHSIVMKYNLATVEQFAAYLYSIVIFGFFVTPWTVEQVFEIDDFKAYVAARTFQGALDYSWSAGQGQSVFIDRFLPTYNTDQIEQAMTQGASVDVVRRLIQQDKVDLTSKGKSLTSTATSHLIALQEARAVDFPSSYMEYLHGPQYFPKVSPAVLYSITAKESNGKRQRNPTAAIDTLPVDPSELQGLLNIKGVQRRMSWAQGRMPPPVEAPGVSGMGSTSDNVASFLGQVGRVASTRMTGEVGGNGFDIATVRAAQEQSNLQYVGQQALQAQANGAQPEDMMNAMGVAAENIMMAVAEALPAQGAPPPPPPDAPAPADAPPPFPSGDYSLPPAIPPPPPPSIGGAPLAFAQYGAQGVPPPPPPPPLPAPVREPARGGFLDAIRSGVTLKKAAPAPPKPTAADGLIPGLAASIARRRAMIEEEESKGVIDEWD